MGSKSFILHHLTDLHVGPLHYLGNRPLFVPDKTSIYSKLTFYLNYLKSAACRPDLVVISGDLTSYAAEEEFNHISDFLHELLSLLDAPPGKDVSTARICIVPGNHDLDWSKDSQEAKIDRFRRTIESFHPRVVSAATRYDPLVVIPHHNVLVYLFNSCALGGVRDPEIEHLRKDIFTKLHTGVSGSETSEIHARLDRLGRRDPGYIAPNDLEQLRVKLPDGHDSMFKVAVMHHNPSSIPDHDIDAYQAIINAGAVKQKLFTFGFDLVLHGHRHFQHCAFEEIVPDMSGDGPSGEKAGRHLRRGFYILSGGTLGSSPDPGRWLELRIEDSQHAHESAPPSSLVSIHSAHLQPAEQTYKLSPKASYRLVVGKPVYTSLRIVQEHLGRTEIPPERLQETQDAVEKLWPPLLDLQGRLDDWDEDAEWKEEFHTVIQQYQLIIGVDLIGPRGWLNPRYLDYILRQFEERERRGFNRNCFAFPEPVFSALKTRGVLGDRLALLDENSNELAIARILLWPRLSKADLPTLKMVTNLHRMFGVPLFMLDSSLLSTEEATQEFVLGITPRREIHHGYEYNLASRGSTRPLLRKSGSRLKRFEAFLQRPELCLATALLAELEDLPSKP